MLVWLIDAIPDVGRAIAALAFGEDPGEDIEASTQHAVVNGRLDALLIGRSFALVVESKIDSGFGDQQIARYLDWLSSTHGHRERLGLMTMTAHEVKWPMGDTERADLLGVCGSAHRWEELHAVLAPLADAADRDALSARLINEFLDMLDEEGLIPVRPLEADEFVLWRDARITVTRFHEFFRACVEAIGAGLGAKPSSNSWSKNEGYIWQDFVYDDGCRVVIGIQDSDERRVPKALARETPLLWMALEAKHWTNWTSAKDQLDANPPAEWLPWKRLWGERPQVWRYLDGVLGRGTFEEQRDRLAAACAVGTGWLRNAEPVGPVAPSAVEAEV
jgi:hypothetical protein